MRLAVLGKGTIGTGVCELIDKSTKHTLIKILENRFTGDRITSRIEDILQDDSIDAVVETMGGIQPAYDFACGVIASGKHFITANKLLVAEYGDELSQLARVKGVAFRYSAACGGAIPYLANLAQARDTDSIRALGGILNGTTNYILDKMHTEKVSYADALAQAQALGFAERDPSSDVNGLDTMRKLILACGVAWNAQVTEKDIPVLGIASVTSADCAAAQKKNYLLRLCAQAKWSEGRLSVSVEPCLVSPASAMGATRLNRNYAWYEGEASGEIGFCGQGAGQLPTASNVMRDIAAVSKGNLSMTLTDSEKVSAIDTGTAHRYLLRAPDPLSVPHEWKKEVESISGAKFVTTQEIRVIDMHTFVREHPGSFAARIPD